MRWRENPQRIAWIILFGSFIACCALTVIVPLAARGYVLHATRSLSTSVTTTAGTVQLRVPGAADPNAVPDRRSFPAGSQVVTDKLAQALITVSTDNAGDQALASVRLFQDTALRVEHADTPRYPWSRDPDSLVLTLERGRVRLATLATGTGRPLQVYLRTPHASTTFDGGTLDIVVRDDETQVTGLSGTARVIGAGSAIDIGGGQRVVVAAGRAPGLPVPAEQNLVRNGTFEQDLAPSWEGVIDVPAEHQPGQVTRETLDRRTVHFLRRAEDGVPNSAGIRQVLEQDVQGHDSLVLQLDLQLLSQSVPGGGERGSEYPIKIDISYRDIYGKDLHWFAGFYFLDLPPGSPWQQPTGQKVPLGVWYTYESPNLYDELKDTRPALIHSITISASGHDYDSLVSDVALVVR